MIRSKLTIVLRSFDKNQFKRFGEFISSPFFNTNPTLIRFYNVIRKHHPYFTKKELEKQKIFNRLYPGRPYHDGTMRNLISDMMCLAQKFIIQLAASENSPDKEISLLVYFNQMKLDDLFEKKILKVETEFSNCLINEEVFFTNLRFLEREKQLFYSIRNKEYLDPETGFRENLYAFYSFLLVLFRAAHNAFNYKNNYNDSSLFRLINELLSILNIDGLICFFKSKNFKYSEIIELYYLNYLAMTNLNNDEFFNSFRQSFEENYLRFTEYALYNLTVAIENCCTYKIQMGKYEFIKEYISFQKWLDLNGIKSTPDKYYYNNSRFINTVTYACYLQDFDWLEQYIKKYLNRLNPEHRKCIHNLSYAYLNFEKGEYVNALSLLESVNYDNTFLKLYVRELLLMIYYESGNFEPAYLMLDSFHHFLTTNKSISDLIKKRYLNFIKILKELLGLKIGSSEKTVKHLRLEITDNRQSLRPKSTKWLLEKINELENK